MRTVYLLAAVLTTTLAGCVSLPYTPTAANDDACLRRSVGQSMQRIRAASDQHLPATRCESMRTTWARVTGPQFNNQSQSVPMETDPQ